jgi:hypothetical protein
MKLRLLAKAALAVALSAAAFLRERQNSLD